MSSFDINAIAEIVREVGATEVMPRFRKLAAGDVQMKGKDDPVTIADQETERHLSLRLTDKLPGSIVVGEEGVSRDKSLLKHLDEDGDYWVIDPIDGTRNFVAGKPEFAIMVALVRNRQSIAAWIHDPNTGSTIMGEQGSGVWLSGKRMRLAASEPSTETVCLVGSRVKKLIAEPALIPQGVEGLPIEIGSCAGFDYPRLFVGETIYGNATDGRAGYLIYRHTNAWDHVPGLFLHREGGGYSANWFNKSYVMTTPLDGLIIAPDQERWLQLHRAFRPLMSHVSKNSVWDF